MEQLTHIKTIQAKAIPFNIISQTYLWDETKYHESINIKKQSFLDIYASRSGLEWNVVDNLAYKKLLK